MFSGLWTPFRVPQNEKKQHDCLVLESVPLCMCLVAGGGTTAGTNVAITSDEQRENGWLQVARVRIKREKWVQAKLGEALASHAFTKPSRSVRVERESPVRLRAVACPPVAPPQILG